MLTQTEVFGVLIVLGLATAVVWIVLEILEGREGGTRHQHDTEQVDEDE
ncbi:hypothetical protein [Pseudoduganella umbonata]|uniref:Uncharacterized protein n=1 Tax=Pseudoduganella umbonata TaxID=864828 RepID=A0A7W5EAU8_9BURK|nr:hypothetical protein [Pseudoduganella umbonata]MBB3221688.1 hypothetical protein [Pseudoduganella umbonata]